MQSKTSLLFSSESINAIYKKKLYSLVPSSADCKKKKKKKKMQISRMSYATFRTDNLSELETN